MVSLSCNDLEDLYHVDSEHSEEINTKSSNRNEKV